jgi:hypothetical protein
VSVGPWRAILKLDGAAGLGRSSSPAPEQRKAAFEASVVTDLDQLPSDYLARLRADAEELAARRDAARRDVPHAS